MIDRFKFRIWDKESQKYHNGMEVFDYMRGVLSPDKYVMEQCTGLKDKNYNLIYEGDIVELDNSVKAVIEWDNDDGCWNIKTSDTIYTFADLYGNETRVIGNIHQNADLLEN